MANSDAIVVLETLMTDVHTCRTECGALEVAIDILEKDSDRDHKSKSLKKGDQYLGYNPYQE